MSSYTLVAYLKAYINPEGTENPVTIQSRTARKWLNRLGYRYRHMGKNVFVDGQERADIIEDQKIFLKIMEEMEPYLVEFDHNGIMLSKIYPSNCEIKRENCRPIIVITYDECTFSSNDGF